MLGNLMLQSGIKRRAADMLTLRFGTRHSRTRPLANLLCFNFRQRRHYREQYVADHFVVGGKVRLGVTVKRDAVASEPLQIHDRGHHALAAEPVKRPEQHAVEYGLSGKWLELLKEIVPGLTRVAVIRDASTAIGSGQLGAIQAVAPSLGVELRPVDVQDPGEIERAIAAFAGASK